MYEHDERPAVAFAAIDNALKAVNAVATLTEAHEDRCGGKLILRGTRFTVAQLIAELADDGDSVRNVCDNYDLDHEQVVTLLQAIATGFSAPVV